MSDSKHQDSQKIAAENESPEVEKTLTPAPDAQKTEASETKVEKAPTPAPVQHPDDELFREEAPSLPPAPIPKTRQTGSMAAMKFDAPKESEPRTEPQPIGQVDVQQSQKPRPPKKFRWILAAAGVIVVLLLWYASSLHRDQYYLVIEGRQAHVERGYYFLFGSSHFAPSHAYEPFTLPVGLSAKSSNGLNLKELDKALHSLYVDAAAREITDLENGTPDTAEDLLFRANKLDSTTEEQRHVFKLMGDVAFRRAIEEVRGVQASFDRALEQFQRASMLGGLSYRGATRWIEAIERLRSDFRTLSLETGLDPDQILQAAPNTFVPAKPAKLPDQKDFELPPAAFEPDPQPQVPAQTAPIFEPVEEPAPLPADNQDSLEKLMP